MKTPQRERTVYDPYDPSSAGYAARSQEHETTVNGTTRVDIGQPVSRTRDEPQPKKRTKPEAPVAPAPAFPVADVPAPVPASVRVKPAELDLKPGLGRRP